MILLADSGSTKTDWCVADGAAEICRIATHGTNPFFQSADEIAQEVDGGLLPQLGNRPIEQIRFYGAGCAFPDKIAVIRDVLAARFTAADIEVGSDMLAAARALCGRNAGIACILGTGSNSCLYDGTEITANVSPLGFILGDEGSGAVLGRTLVGDCLKNQLPTGLREKFLSRFGLTPADRRFSRKTSTYRKSGRWSKTVSRASCAGTYCNTPTAASFPCISPDRSPIIIRRSWKRPPSNPVCGSGRSSARRWKDSSVTMRINNDNI